MEEMYALSNLAICRSGAMTVTELAISQKPAIFIPLPSVGANRQEDNARMVEKIDGGRVILNQDLTGEKLSDNIDGLIKDLAHLEIMGKNVNKLEIKNVDDKIYAEIKSIVNK